MTNTEKAQSTQNERKDGVLAECKYFNVKKLDVSGKASDMADTTSFVSITVVSGSGNLAVCGNSFDLKKGDSLFVPAQDALLDFEGNMEIIISRV